MVIQITQEKRSVPAGGLAADHSIIMTQDILHDGYHYMPDPTFLELPFGGSFFFFLSTSMARATESSRNDRPRRNHVLQKMPGSSQRSPQLCQRSAPSRCCPRG